MMMYEDTAEAPSYRLPFQRPIERYIEQVDSLSVATTIDKSASWKN